MIMVSRSLFTFLPFPRRSLLSFPRRDVAVVVSSTGRCGAYGTVTKRQGSDVWSRLSSWCSCPAQDQVDVTV